MPFLPDLLTTCLERFLNIKNLQRKGETGEDFHKYQNPQDQTSHTPSPQHDGFPRALTSVLGTCVSHLVLFEELLLVFEVQAPKQRTVHRGCSSHSECNRDSVASMMRKKEPLSRHLWLVFFLKRIDRTEFSQEPEPVPSAAGVEWNCSLPSVSCCHQILQLHHLPTSSPSAGNSLAYAYWISPCMPVIVLSHCTFSKALLWGLNVPLQYCVGFC